MTVIQILVMRFVAVIWRFPAEQSNVWRKNIAKHLSLSRYLKKWDVEERYFVHALWFPFSFALGAGVYFSVVREPDALIYLALSILIIAAVMGWFQLRAVISAFPQFLLLVLIWFTLGFGWSGFRTHLIDTNTLSASQDRVMIEGWITAVSSSDTRERLTLRVHAISDTLPHKAPKFVRVSQRTKNDLHAGRFVRCYGQLNPPPEPTLDGDFEFSRDAFFNGLGAVGFVYGQCKPGTLPERSGWFVAVGKNIQQLRRSTATFIADNGGRGGGLAAALLTGDRSFISDEDAETLRASGLAHLLAISGLHMGLAGGAFYFLFFRMLVLIEPLSKRLPMQKPAALAALLAVTFYLVFSGASISAQRAYVMVGMAFLAILFDRPAISFNTLGIAMLLMVIISPNAVVTPGFQMSFAAAAALVRAFSTWRTIQLPDLPYVPKFVTRTFAPIFLTSVVAGLATSPFALFHFGRVAPWGILANFLIMPLVTVICVPLAVATVIGMLVGLPLIPLKAFGWSLGLVLSLASHFADSSGPDFALSHPLPGFALLTTILAMVAWILSSKRLPRLSLVLLAATAIIWFATPKRDLIYASNGYIALNVEGAWKSLRLAKAGLRPLSFSRLEEIRCAKGCEMNTQIGLLEITPEWALVIHTTQKVYHLDLADQSSFALTLRQDEVQRHLISYDKCRPWTRSWPTCRNG